MRARDIMTRDVITVRRDTPVREIVRILLEHRISGVPVVEEGRVVGIVSEGDLILRERAHRTRSGIAFLAQQLFEDHAKLAEEFRKAHGTTAEQVMSREVFTCHPGTPVAEVANLMAERRIKRVPVVDRDQLVGIVSRADVLRAVATRLDAYEQALQRRALSDDEIREELVRMLKREPWAEVELIDVHVRDGVVTLRGVAESVQEKEALELAARAIPGVRGVVSELTVNPEAALEA